MARAEMIGIKIDYKTECTIGGKNYIENVFYFDNIKKTVILKGEK